MRETVRMDEDNDVTAHDFKLGMRQVVSSVAIVTSRAGGERNGLTATAVCPVSVEPPTMLVCVNRNASAEAVIAESGCFAVNFLTEEQHGIARLFSTPKLSAERRFAEGTWLTMVTGSPVLDGAAASFDCEVTERIASGSHHIYIGRVVALVSVDRDALLYRDGQFRKLEQLI